MGEFVVVYCGEVDVVALDYGFGVRPVFLLFYGFCYLFGWGYCAVCWNCFHLFLVHFIPFHSRLLRRKRLTLQKPVGRIILPTTRLSHMITIPPQLRCLILLITHSPILHNLYSAVQSQTFLNQQLSNWILGCCRCLDIY